MRSGRVNKESNRVLTGMSGPHPPLRGTLSHFAGEGGPKGRMRARISREWLFTHPPECE